MALYELAWVFGKCFVFYLSCVDKIGINIFCNVFVTCSVMASLKCVVEADDVKLVTIHREFIKWKNKNPSAVHSEFGFAVRHFNRLYSELCSANMKFTCAVFTQVWKSDNKMLFYIWAQR